MKKSQIAIQFYTLRDQVPTPARFAEACAKVRAIGYRAAQISGIDMTAIPPQEIRRICAEHDLVICGVHAAPADILHNPQSVLELLETLDAPLAAFPYPSGVDFSDETAVSTLINKLEESGRFLAAHGRTLCYHNHQIEFRRSGGRTILDRIYAETNPAHLQAELDTHWVQYGGGCPAAWCARMTGRLPLLHLKDFRINERNEIEFAEVGAGNLDFPAILAEAERAGCHWFVVEQDTCPGDPFDSIRMSWDYLATLAED